MAVPIQRHNGQTLHLKTPTITTFQVAMLERLAKKKEMEGKRRSVGEIYVIPFIMPNFPTNLVWTLKVSSDSYRFFPAEDLAEGFRMLHNIESGVEFHRHGPAGHQHSPRIKPGASVTLSSWSTLSYHTTTTGRGRRSAKPSSNEKQGTYLSPLFPGDTA